MANDMPATTGRESEGVGVRGKGFFKLKTGSEKQGEHQQQKEQSKQEQPQHQQAPQGKRRNRNRGRRNKPPIIDLKGDSISSASSEPCYDSSMSPVYLSPCSEIRVVRVAPVVAMPTVTVDVDVSRVPERSRRPEPVQHGHSVLIEAMPVIPGPPALRRGASFCYGQPAAAFIDHDCGRVNAVGARDIAFAEAFAHAQRVGDARNPTFPKIERLPFKPPAAALAARATTIMSVKSSEVAVPAQQAAPVPAQKEKLVPPAASGGVVRPAPIFSVALMAAVVAIGDIALDGDAGVLPQRQLAKHQPRPASRSQRAEAAARQSPHTHRQRQKQRERNRREGRKQLIAPSGDASVPATAAAAVAAAVPLPAAGPSAAPRPPTAVTTLAAAARTLVGAPAPTAMAAAATAPTSAVMTLLSPSPSPAAAASSQPLAAAAAPEGRTLENGNGVTAGGLRQGPRHWRKHGKGQRKAAAASKAAASAPLCG
ncbi:unnamed protein product [Phaeothamnion confervicola]